jgi:inosine-uridine nucleoside N-ribohydrolase/drug/metabolite transporter superfamily protein YnfA
MIYFLWELILAIILLSIGLAIWQRGNGFRVAFTMFPCALEFTRFALFDDLSTGTTHLFLLMRAAAVFIYFGVVVLITRQRPRRAHWWILIAGALLYFFTAIVTSFPVFIFFTIYPAYLPPTGVLVLGSLIIGLGIDGHQARRRLSTLIRIALLAVIILSIVSLLIPWFTGDALPTPPYAPIAAKAPGSRQAVIIDTDLSNDDYVAILYLLQRPDVDILGITVANGNVHVEPGLENIQRLLAFAEREGIPIAAGSSTPLLGENAFPDFLRGSVDFGIRPTLPKPRTPIASPSAPDLICQLVADSPSPVTLLALGPLTNVAQALQDDTALASQLDAVIFSGGMLYIESADLIDPINEVDWNIFVDPYAADVVFRSGVPLTLIPLDVTDTHSPHSILISKDFVTRLEAKAHGRESQLIVHFLRNWLLLNGNADIVPLWDAPVATIAIDPAVCTDWQELSVHIALEPEDFPGKTIVDEDGRPNIRVCLAGDQVAFEANYLATVH